MFIGQGYHGMQAVGAYPVSGILDMKNPRLNNISVFMSLPLAQEFLSADNLMVEKYGRVFSFLTNSTTRCVYASYNGSGAL